MSSPTEFESQVSKAVKGYLGRLIDEVWQALADGKGSFANPVFSLGTLLGWYIADVADPLVNEIEAMWDKEFPVNEARARHIAAVRDRLATDIEPEIPIGAFDSVRLSQSLAATQGWTPQQMARDIAERLSWEPNKDFWKRQKDDAEAEIDAILDPLGPPGTPARTIVHKSDPRIKELQALRAEAVTALRADESVWKDRAQRIARTEFTAMQAAGSLAALVAEGVTHKRWLSTRDGRTRHSHAEANGQVVDILGAFDVGGFLMQIPGDPTAPPEETVNCRCTIVGATEDDYKRSMLTAGATSKQPWEYQVRVPKGNGKRSGRWIDMPGKVLMEMFSEEALSYYSDEDEDLLLQAIQQAIYWHPETVGAERFLERADEYLEQVERDSDPAIAEARKYIDDFITGMDWSLYNPATDMEQDEDIGYGDEDDWYDDDPEPSQGYSGDPYEEYLRLLQNGGVPSNKALSQAVSGMLEDDEIAGVSAEAALLWTSALQEALAGTGVTLRLDQLENDGRELRLSWSLTDDDGHEIGTMNRWATEYEVHHDYFTLEPEYQGKGIAQRLNTAAEDLYRANGIQYITLDANIDVGGYAWAKQGYTLDVDKGGRDAMKDVLRRLAMEITMSSKVFDLVEAFSTHMVYHGDYPANLVYFIEELRSLGVEVDFSDGDEFDYEWRAQVLLQAYLDHFGERDSEDAIFRLLDLAADAFGNSEIQMWDIASFGQGDPKWERTVEITQWDSTGRTMTRTPKVTWPGKEALLGARWPGRKDL